MKNSLDFYRQSKGPTQDRQEEFGPIWNMYKIDWFFQK